MLSSLFFTGGGWAFVFRKRVARPGRPLSPGAGCSAGQGAGCRVNSHPPDRCRWERETHTGTQHCFLQVCRALSPWQLSYPTPLGFSAWSSADPLASPRRGGMPVHVARRTPHTNRVPSVHFASSECIYSSSSSDSSLREAATPGAKATVAMVTAASQGLAQSQSE